MSEEQERQIVFNYVKNDDYRTFSLDGVVGGVTPTGKIHMGLFVNRLPIAQKVTHEITAEGAIGPVIPDQTIGKKGIVREVQAGLLLDLETARNVIEWLKEKVEAIEDIDRQRKPGD